MQIKDLNGFMITIPDVEEAIATADESRYYREGEFAYWTDMLNKLLRTEAGNNESKTHHYDKSAL